MKQIKLQVPNGLMCIFRTNEAYEHPQCEGLIIAYGLKKDGTWAWEKGGYNPHKRGLTDKA